MVLNIILGLAIYIYMAFAMMTVAKRLNYKYPWLAWIPIANIWLLPELAKMHWWPAAVLVVGYALMSLQSAALAGLGFIAILVGLVYAIIWMWKICEFRKRPGWWAVLTIIPIIGSVWALIMWGILAWGK